MSGLRSLRVELAIAKLIGARKVSRAYQGGHDLELPLSDDRMLRIECKARAEGFRELYSWLDERDVLILRLIGGSGWSSCDCPWRCRSSRLAAALMWA